MNAWRFPKNYEVNTLPSKTIPDQSLSLAEILRRFAVGLPVGGQRVPVYNPDDFTPDLATLDLSERMDLLEENANRIKQMQYDLSKPKRSTTASPEPSKALNRPGPAPSEAGGGASNSNNSNPET